MGGTDFESDVTGAGGGGLEQKGAKVVGTSMGLGTEGSNNATLVESMVSGDTPRFRDREGSVYGGATGKTGTT